MHPSARSGARRLVLPAAAAALLTAGCGDREPPESGRTRSDTPGTADAGAVAFAPELGVDPIAMNTTPSGVLYTDVQTGRGALAEPGRQVTVEYRAWLPDGTLFEERPNDAGWGPSEFLLGSSAPVAGLNEGIAGMRTGGVRRIVIPPEQGYGLVGRPEGVPEGSTLVFEVRVTAVRD